MKINWLSFIGLFLASSLIGQVLVGRLPIMIILVIGFSLGLMWPWPIISKIGDSDDQ